MAYSDFTLEIIEARFQLKIQSGNLNPHLAKIEIPNWLNEYLQRAKALSQTSEKAKSEFVIAPILLAVREIARRPISILSGSRLDVDPSKGLVGECDFILTESDTVPMMRAPLMAIVEAKKGDFELALGQCAAQMLAAQIYNQQHKEPSEVVIGCVTNSDTWLFLQLQKQNLTIHSDRLYLNQLSEILGIFLALLHPPLNG